MVDRRVGRLSAIEDPELKLRPLRKATELPGYFVYWIPVGANPARQSQRVWLNAFLDRLSDYLTSAHKLRVEVFLQFKTIYPRLMDVFLEQAEHFVPIIGFGYTPGVPLPIIPTMEDLEPLIKGQKPYNFGDYVGDYTYWFLGKGEKKQRELFLGEGGMTLMFMPPGDAGQPLPTFSPRLREHPAFKPLFDRFDPAEVIKKGDSLSDKWLKQSLEAYGADLPKSPQMKGIPFILPLLASRHLLTAAAEREKLSGLCQFYVTESLEDRGIILASATDHEPALLEILDAMHESGMDYPER